MPGRLRTWGIAAGLQAALCLGSGLVGLGASVRHLGRPLLAYRAVLGVRHSWLSREVHAWSYIILAMVYVSLEVVRPAWFWSGWGTRAALLGLVVATGFAGVECRCWFTTSSDDRSGKRNIGGIELRGPPSCWGWPWHSPRRELLRPNLLGQLDWLATFWPLAAIAFA